MKSIAAETSVAIDANKRMLKRKTMIKARRSNRLSLRARSRLENGKNCTEEITMS